ncbi:hypothetical protein BTVI_97929 [Pitangus sulphuratus]|nr:hypothetical protein BTVI_97929 [Pitangus sulphuratus]
MFCMGQIVPGATLAWNWQLHKVEIDDCNQKDLREDSAGVPNPSSAQAEKAEVKQDSLQAAAAGDNSVMSFLKTLVSPSKAEAKSDSEDKSPEQQPVTSVKPDKNVPPSQEPLPAKQNPKAPEAAAAPQGAASEAPREGMKEKPSATPMPLSKLFWKKNSSEEAEAVSNEKTEASFEAVAPDRVESKSLEGSEAKPRAAESKTPKANLRKFFKLTLNPTEKPLAPAEGDPAGQRSKESSKDKKSTVELSKQKGSKQESREQPDPREQPAADTDSIQNGGDASKEPSYKKTEKRQSLGGFFKGLKGRYEEVQGSKKTVFQGQDYERQRERQERCLRFKRQEKAFRSREEIVRRVPKGRLMQRCKQIQCPSYLLGNPSNGSTWLLEAQQLSVSSLAVDMTHSFPLHGCHQVPEAKANTGVSFKNPFKEKLLWRTEKLTETLSNAQCGLLGLEQSTAEIENDSPDNATNGLKSTKSFPDSLMGSKEKDVNQDRQRNL